MIYIYLYIGHYACAATYVIVRWRTLTAATYVIVLWKTFSPLNRASCREWSAAVWIISKIPLLMHCCIIYTVRLAKIFILQTCSQIAQNTFPILIMHIFWYGIEYSNYHFQSQEKPSSKTIKYLLIHRVIRCNKWLCDKKIHSESGCNFCNDVDSIILYILWKYQAILETFLYMVEQYIWI